MIVSMIITEQDEPDADAHYEDDFLITMQKQCVLLLALSDGRSGSGKVNRSLSVWKNSAIVITGKYGVVIPVGEFISNRRKMQSETLTQCNFDRVILEFKKESCFVYFCCYEKFKMLRFISCVLWRELCGAEKCAARLSWGREGQCQCCPDTRPCPPLFVPAI